MQGDIESATRLIEQGQALPGQRSDHKEAALTQAAGFVAMFAGDTTRAEQLLSKASRSFAASGDPAQHAFCEHLLALACSLLDDLDGSLAHHRTCMELTEAAGETWLRSWSMWTAGQALWTRGDIAAANDLVTQSLRLKWLLADPLGIAVLLETLAWFASPTDPERAAILQGAAQNEWDKIDTTSQVQPGLGPPHRQSIEAARDRLGNPAFDRAWSRGRALEQGTAVALALDEQHPSPGQQADQGSVTTSSHPILTRRERQIAELVHQGLSNKEIADNLVISVRTAETHVENILTKLGFTSRTQVASWFGEQTGSMDR